MSHTGIRLLGAKHAASAPGANSDIFSAGQLRAVSQKVALVRVIVVLATASVFNYTVTDGTTAYTVGLNESIALNASDAYEFEIAAGSDYTYNFQVETDGVIRHLLVIEVMGAV